MLGNGTVLCYHIRYFVCTVYELKVKRKPINKLAILGVRLG
jgi:hypothetical protein